MFRTLSLRFLSSLKRSQKKEMAKRLKLKISRLAPIFHSCRSKDPSDLPLPPVSLTPRRPSFKRRVSSAFSSVGCCCGCGTRSTAFQLSDIDCKESPPPPTPEFLWAKEDKWHVIAKAADHGGRLLQTPRHKVYCSSENDDVLPPPAPPNTVKKRRRRRKNKRLGIRVSTSSADSGLFSSESVGDEEIVFGEDETETLVLSSRSFSTDSSSESKMRRRARSTRAKPCDKKGKSRGAEEESSPARLSVLLQKIMPCAAEGKVRESVAVVKRSEDPYGDFKRSMMEMILEKEMFDDGDLEQLLHCFLSLNSRQHHEVIVRAFAEIWEALFGRRSPSFRVSRG